MGKHELTDIELAMFFRTLPRRTQGRAVWKQAYLSSLLVFMTGARSGSFLAGSGYHKGAPLGDGTTFCDEDETLRFRDLAFQKVESGIAVCVTFRYPKDHRNSHQQQVRSQKIFSLLSLASNRYEFDLALLLTVTAFERGLFDHRDRASLYSVADGTILRMKPDVLLEPVFVPADNKGTLRSGIAMKSASANDKRHQICLRTGLTGRYTPYSLRRTMIQEVKRKHGTEYAQYAAGHRTGNDIIQVYDEIGQGDVDWVADRLDQHGPSQSEMRQLFADLRTSAAATVHLTHGRTAEMYHIVDERLVADREYTDSVADMEKVIMRSPHVCNRAERVSQMHAEISICGSSYVPLKSRILMRD